ncbi:GIY-YIG nuclease family protein [Clostridium sp. chh4-2]|uniref:GIY-YIG nuclease family protein n=1 Tax=Clostridium sp. chh4-2 TaxID=2067550 RepID=UPI0015E199C4|nr:GIY-YIG nuclease family protein [Clostridium sp. chh4-2]
MDIKRKKELLTEWKNRNPEMGVISFRCKCTGQSFLGISKDTKADYNSNHFKLLMGGHPNKRMQELWNRCGEDTFEYAVLKVLKYDDPKADHKDELEALREKCLAADPQAEKIWR